LARLRSRRFLRALCHPPASIGLQLVVESKGRRTAAKDWDRKAGLEPLCELADASGEELHAAKKELIDVKPSCTQDALALLRLACENLETFNELEAWETDVLRRANSYLQRVAA
jgi:hypothetical protein